MDKWKEVMDLAQRYGFITQAYGGAAILMTHENQKEAGIYERVQYTNGLGPHPKKVDANAEPE